MSASHPAFRVSLEASLARIAGRIVSTVIPSRDPRRGRSISVSFADNATLRKAKRRYLRADARFVDVLAFPEPDTFPFPPGVRRPLGEIYLNEVFADRRTEELLFMLVHGVLHLLGYRHGKKRDTMVMEQLEKRLCARFARAMRNVTRGKGGEVKT